MPGIQSTKETCTGGSEIGGSPHGALACAERIAASRNVQLANANWEKGQKRVIPGHDDIEPHQCACQINTDCSTMFSEFDVRKRVQADPPRVII
jgi:hypothetical protein